MTFDEVVKLISTWPKNKDVPRLVQAAYEKAEGEEKFLIGKATESLYVAAEDEYDLRIISSQLEGN
tara:strand:+ start:1022 stop:1219 length:198 start_codon:yes stop_codon:yes gene_type:complete